MGGGTPSPNPTLATNVFSLAPRQAILDRTAYTECNDAAYCYRRSVVSVCLSVCLLDITVGYMHAKLHWIHLPGPLLDIVRLIDG